MDESKNALDAVSREELVEVARKLKPLQKKFDTLVDKYKETVKEGTVRKKELENAQEQKIKLELELQEQKKENDKNIEIIKSEMEKKIILLQTQLAEQQKDSEQELLLLQKQESLYKTQLLALQAQLQEKEEKETERKEKESENERERVVIDEQEHAQGPPSKPPDISLHIDRGGEREGAEEETHTQTTDTTGATKTPSTATTATTATTAASTATTILTDVELETQLLIINELKAKNSTLLESVRDAHDNKTLAQDKEKEARRNLEKFKKEMKTLEEKYKQQITVLQKEKQDLETCVSELNKKLEIEINSYETYKTNTNLLIQKQEQAHLTSLEHVEQLKAVCTEKDNKHNSYIQEINELRSKIGNLEKRQGKAVANEQEIVELRTKCEALHASCEQEKLERKKEKTRHLQELEIEREERVRERGSQEQVREKLTHLRYEETEKAHAKWQETHMRVTKLEEINMQLTHTIEELNKNIEKKQKEILGAKEEEEATKKREDILIKEHEETIKISETKQNDKYQRLLREFKAYRERTTKILDEQANKLTHNSELITKLEEEITTGKPEERRMFELAELQARRDVHIQQQEAQLAEMKGALETHNSVVRQLEEDKKMLAEQCKQLQTSRSRGEVNLDYLKNVLLRFFCASEGSAERKSLIPAIGKILQFTPEETACLNPQGSATWWNMFVPATPTPKVSMWAGQDVTSTPSSSFTNNTPPPTPPPRRGSAASLPDTPSNVSSSNFSAPITKH